VQLSLQVGQAALLVRRLILDRRFQGRGAAHQVQGAEVDGILGVGR
jgi:hypothetical protein